MEFQEIIEVDPNLRTEDVRTKGSFESLMISPSTVANLKNHGYRIPSPVQMKAIPTGLTGLDMLVQAKSGTGKTLVFAIIAVENLNLQSNNVQKIIIAPTREIATQIKDTIKMIAHFTTRIALLVGGTPVHLDVQALKRGVHIVVGTTGRICQMAQSGALNMSSIDLFVLDEADKLMEDCFQKDINYLFSALPPSRQVAVFSATYPRDLDKLLAKFMRDASLVRLNSEDVQLIGIKQYVAVTNQPSVDCLVRLLKSVQFNQALVFCNFYQQCEPTCSHLEKEGFSALYISAQMTQPERDSVIEKLKHNKLKVLVSTDLYFLFFLTARGIDASNVNLVVNLETAINLETYFHRIGRAARYGGYGAAVTILGDSRELGRFKAMTWKGGVNVRVLDLEGIPSDLTTNQSYFDSCYAFDSCAKKQILHNGKSKAAPSTSECPPVLRDCNATYSDLPKGGSYERKTLLHLSTYEKPLSERMLTRLRSLDIYVGPDYGHSQTENSQKADIQAKAVQLPDKNANGFYDRKAMVELSKDGVPLSEEMQTHLNDLEIYQDPSNNGGGNNYVKEVAELSAKILKSKNANVNEKASSPIPTPPEQPKKYKFVPSRQKAKRKFYMRGELVSIRDSVSEDSWRKYALSKFDMSVDPFLTPGPGGDSRSCEDGIMSGTISRGTPVSVKKERTATSKLGAKKYSRKDLIAIQNSVPKKAWLPYVKTRWDTTQEPFQLNQYLRCPFEEQLRRQRQLEKKQRAEVMKERLRAQMEKPKLLASARTPSHAAVKESSFDMFCSRVKEDFKKFQEGEYSSESNLGPVVPLRDPPEVWRAKVEYYTALLRNFDTTFKYDVYKEAGLRREVAVETNLEALVVAQLGSELEARGEPGANEQVNQEEAHEEEDRDDRAPSSSQNDPNFEEMKMLVNVEKCSRSEDEVAATELYSEEESPHSVSEQRLVDEEESGIEESSEETSDSEGESSFDEEEEQLRRFAEAYRKNVDFHIVFSSYLWMLNRRYH